MILQCEHTKVLIKDSHIQDAINELDNWYGVKLNKAQMLRFLRKHYEVAVEVMGGVGTGCREQMIETLAEDLTGMTWPTYGDGKKAMDKLWPRFKRAAKRAGYKITAEEA